MGTPEAAAPELTGEGVSEHSWTTDTVSLVGRQAWHLQLQIYKLSARTNWAFNSVMNRLTALEDRDLLARCFNFWRLSVLPVQLLQRAAPNLALENGPRHQPYTRLECAKRFQFASAFEGMLCEFPGLLCTYT